MKELTHQQTKEIAEQLDCGFRCFVNRKNNEIVFIPDLDKYPEIEIEFWEKEEKKLDKNPEDFEEIEQLQSRDSFNIMVQFTETLDDSDGLKLRLIRALNNRKPFSHFKFEIDNSVDHRQRWFDFKDQKLQAWVVDKIEGLIEMEKFNEEIKRQSN